MSITQRQRYFTVITNGTVDEVLAYLYSHTEIVRTVPVVVAPSITRQHILLRTVADTDGNVDYLTRYQAERLASGLHYATNEFFPTETLAVDHHFGRFEVSLAEVTP